MRQQQYNQTHQQGGYPSNAGGGPGGIPPQQGAPSQQPHPHQYPPHMRYPANYHNRPQKLPLDPEGMSGGEPQSSVYMYRQPPRYPYPAQTSPVPSPHGQVRKFHF